MATLAGKTLFITGAKPGDRQGDRPSGGAGRRERRSGGQDGRREPESSPARSSPPRGEIEEAGGKALPLQVDIRFEGADRRGGGEGGGDVRRDRHPGEQRQRDQPDGDAGNPDEAVRPDVRGSTCGGTFASSQALLPYLVKGSNPHILNLSPPLSLDPKWFRGHCAYTMSKYGMSFCVLGMSEEFRDAGVAVNALWPKTGDRHGRSRHDPRGRYALLPEARHRRGRGARDPHPGQPVLHGQLLHRRGGCSPRKA